ncbi:MAG: hypothetical protein NTV79_09590 [Candidatus Aureabacteria bacterium]|nr:hypothetical protein [Candidatus Auribacterota bacterium]
MIGFRRQGRAVFRDRLLDLAFPERDIPQTVAGRRDLHLARDGAVEISPRPGPVLLFQIEKTEEIVGRGEGGIGLKGRLNLGHRRVGFPELAVEDCLPVAQGRGVRTERQGLVKLGEGLVVLLAFLVERAQEIVGVEEVEMGGGLTGEPGNRFSVILHGPGGVALGLAAVADFVVETAIVGAGGERRLQALLRPGDVPLLKKVPPLPARGEPLMLGLPLAEIVPGDIGMKPHPAGHRRRLARGGETH